MSQNGNGNSRGVGVGGVGTGSASSLGGSSSKKRGVDAILTVRGKQLRPGGSCAFRLVKGPVLTASGDPVDRAAPRQAFPLVAKFPESVVRPDFADRRWRTARLYQQNVPKPERTASDEEAELAAAEQPKKRWKFGRRNQQQDAPRQWILQEQVDFLETMVRRRQQKTGGSGGSGAGGAAEDSAGSGDRNGGGGAANGRLSSRYEGAPEHNASHYVVFLHNDNDNDNDDKDSSNADTAAAAATPTIRVCSVPAPHGTIAFAQPAARRTFTLSQAEQAIHDQRSGVLTLNQLRADANANHDDDDSSAERRREPVMTEQRRAQLALQKQRAMMKSIAARSGGGNKSRANTSKNRLLERLQRKKAASAADAEEVEEGDDVMGDVTFRARKGAGSARRELFTSLGDGVAVSDDGVMGGTNDAAFGGRGQRFGQFKAEEKGGAAAGAKQSGAAADRERGADGAAMSDDFYQRDVKAEYDELDFDAAEQFDDDDVDVGETEMADAAGFGGDAAADDEDDDDDDDDDEGEMQVSGAEGLASVAGFRAMLAKARGEVPAAPPGGAAAAAAGENADAAAQAAAAAAGGGNADETKNKDAASAAAAAGMVIDPKTKRPVPSPNSAAAAAAASAAAAAAAAARKKKAAAEEDDHMAKIVGAVDQEARLARERAAMAASRAQQAEDDPNNAAAAAQPPSAAAAAAAQMPAQQQHQNQQQPQEGTILVDENGQRIITQDAVRREIWLHHGSIGMKRLMKIFDVKKKTPAGRREKFRSAVKELCTMKTDPLGERMLVLKQHYSHIAE